MDDELLARLQTARTVGEPCVLVTVAATRGSVPRAAGAKMLVLAGGENFGTIGGGKFESLVVAEALAVLHAETPLLKTYPLHEGSTESFGAICGGEVTVFFEPMGPKERLVIVGAGHCAKALARMALDCGWHVTAIDDRSDEFRGFPDVQRRIEDRTPPEFIARHPWHPREALVLVSRNFQIDREALAAALGRPEIAYLGMIGSRKKVRHVFAQLTDEGVATPEKLARVRAPIGLDIGADSPVEIAVSIIAEILQVLRGGSGEPLRAARAP